MISFDRRTGNVNLTPLWNEINSIKSDTLSMWDFMSTITGVDIASSILSSISDVKSSISSLISDTSSMASDIGSINLDVVSLYNICSSLSSSLSTLSGGNPYYLALSDALASSLKYVYNMTGNITTLPSYDSFTFIGNLGNFSSYSVLNKSFKLHGLQNMASITFSNGSLDYYDLSAKTMNNNIFKNITGGFRLDCESFSSNTLEGISNCYLTAKTISGMSLRTVYGIFNLDVMSNCYLSSFVGTMNANILSSNTFTYNRCPINVNHMFKNSIVHYVHPDLWVNSSMFSNTIEAAASNDLYPNIYAPVFSANSLKNPGNSFSLYGNTIMGNTISCETDHAKTYSKNKLDVQCIYSCVNNGFYNIASLNINGKLQGGHTFSKIGELRLDAYEFNLGGGHGENINSYNNITKLDLRGLKPSGTFYPINIDTASLIGVQTALLNYSVSFRVQGVQKSIAPSNIYTLDFYDCESALSNSIFTIQNYYTSYDEGNVWISGKPLSELGYTLSVSS